MKQYTKEELIDFEKEVVAKFKEGNTYSPVHLSGSIDGKQEDALIKIFKNIKDDDWIFSTHRSHYHALLKSGDRDWLINEIIVNANSSHINSTKHKIFTSAIVGGCIPIALGVAMGIKMKQNKLFKKQVVDKEKLNIKEIQEASNRIYCFIGDMASEMGCFWEAVKYAEGENLPITFIIEDNFIGCFTKTNDVWKKRGNYNSNRIIHYNYERIYGHYGIGSFVEFKKKHFKSIGDYQAFKSK